MQSFLSLIYIFPTAHSSLKGAVTINEEITKKLVQNNLLPHLMTVPSALNSEPVALRIARGIHTADAVPSAGLFQKIVIRLLI